MSDDESPGEAAIEDQLHQARLALTDAEGARDADLSDAVVIKTEILTRLVRMTGLLKAPPVGNFSGSVLTDRRSSTRIQLVARILDIQPKDVPIVVLAFEHSEREPTILTHDATFTALTPCDHEARESCMEFLRCGKIELVDT